MERKNKNTINADDIRKAVVVKRDSADNWSLSYTCTDGFGYSFAACGLTRRALVAQYMDDFINKIIEGGHSLN